MAGWDSGMGPGKTERDQGGWSRAQGLPGSRGLLWVLQEANSWQRCWYVSPPSVQPGWGLWAFPGQSAGSSCVWFVQLGLRVEGIPVLLCLSLAVTRKDGRGFVTEGGGWGGWVLEWGGGPASIKWGPILIGSWLARHLVVRKGSARHCRLSGRRRRSRQMSCFGAFTSGGSGGTHVPRSGWIIVAHWK